MHLSSIRVASLMVSLAVLFSLAGCGESDGDALTIVRLEHENLVFMNGDRLPLTIHWEGTAEFPVTVSLAVPEGECPADVICHDETHEITERGNPIVVDDALWCTGQGDAFSAPWDVTIEDARGEKSEAARMEYTCRS